MPLASSNLNWNGPYGKRAAEPRRGATFTDALFFLPNRPEMDCPTLPKMVFRSIIWPTRAGPHGEIFTTLRRLWQQREIHFCRANYFGVIKNSIPSHHPPAFPALLPPPAPSS